MPTQSLEHTELMHYIPRLKWYTNDSKSPEGVEPDDQMNMVSVKIVQQALYYIRFFLVLLTPFLSIRSVTEKGFYMGNQRLHFSKPAVAASLPDRMYSLRLILD